jgi:hypothetical protein
MLDCLNIFLYVFLLLLLLGWLQCKVVHFSYHNPSFCKVMCISMLLTWHKNTNSSNLWLDLDCQLEKKRYLFFKIAIYIHQIYSNGLLKLKNMDWFVVCASIYMHFCV